MASTSERARPLYCLHDDCLASTKGYASTAALAMHVRRKHGWECLPCGTADATHAVSPPPWQSTSVGKKEWHNVAHTQQVLSDAQHRALCGALEQLARARPEANNVHRAKVYHNLIDPNLSLQCVLIKPTSAWHRNPSARRSDWWASWVPAEGEAVDELTVLSISDDESSDDDDAGACAGGELSMREQIIDVLGKSKRQVTKLFLEWEGDDFDGTCSKDELHKALIALGLSEGAEMKQAVDELFDSLDRERGGGLQLASLFREVGDVALAWVPATCALGAHGRAWLTSGIPQLPRAPVYEPISAAVEALVAAALPRLEAASLADGQSFLRREGQQLQVVVKAQRIQLGASHESDAEPPSLSYSGLWHVDGTVENVVGVVLYYTRVDDGLVGGELAFVPRALHDNVTFGWSSEIRDSIADAQKVVPVAKGTAVCFRNDALLHRVLEMRVQGLTLDPHKRAHADKPGTHPSSDMGAEEAGWHAHSVVPWSDPHAAAKLAEARRVCRTTLLLAVRLSASIDGVTQALALELILPWLVEAPTLRILRGEPLVREFLALFIIDPTAPLVGCAPHGGLRRRPDADGFISIVPRERAEGLRAKLLAEQLRSKDVGSFVCVSTGNGDCHDLLHTNGASDAADRDSYPFDGTTTLEMLREWCDELKEVPDVLVRACTNPDEFREDGARARWDWPEEPEREDGDNPNE